MNVSGPWADQVLGGLENAPGRPLRRGTKGGRVVVGPFTSTRDTAVYAEARVQHRPFFVIPCSEACLIGTTDARYTGDLYFVPAPEGEITWLLEEVNTLFLRAD